MQTMNLATKKLISLLVLVSLCALSGGSAAIAADGTWTQTVDGNWGGGTNWSGGMVADGADSTAFFDQIEVIEQPDPFYRTSIGLEAPRTIGHMVFGDTNLATPGTWEIYLPGSPQLLTLAGTNPSITVNTLTPIVNGPQPNDDVIIKPRLAGTDGLTKAGPGTLTIGPAITGSTNTITGGINIAAGKLRVQDVLPNQAYTLAGGTTWETVAQLGAGANPLTGSVTIADGQTATVRMNSPGTMFPIRGNGSTLNFVLGDVGLHEMRGDWALGGGLANLNVSTDPALGPGQFRLDENRDPNNFNQASFATTNVNLDNVTMLVRTRSNGNTVPLGSLSGTSTAVLSGGAAGSAVRYEIGGLNTDSTYSGNITGGTPGNNGVAGISINKVGTGKLTLAGTWTGPLNNGNGIPARQGGVVRVTTGTLAITGASSIPGGQSSFLTTIDVLPTGTFDVTGAPSTFTTSALQKVQGSGNIIGNWNHAAGFINPADVGAPTAANEGNLSAGVTPTAGTIHFNGDLTMSGGTINYDMSPDPNSGNDLVHVTGTTTLTSGIIAPNFLGTVPTTGTYTVMSSDGGFSGAGSNITVKWPGRGAEPTATVVGNTLRFNAQPIGEDADLVWTGANGGTWDIETTQAWHEGGSPESFYNVIDTVTFDDTAPNKTVIVGAVVTPESFTINNNSTYTFQGTGSIVGTTGLTKTGTGNIVARQNNAFSGPVSLAGGTMDMETFGGFFGTGPMTANNVTFTAINGGGLTNSSIAVSGTTTFQANGTVGTNNGYNIPALTGTGTVNIVSTTTAAGDKWFVIGNTTGFNGTVNLTGQEGMTPNHYRFANNTQLAGSVVNLNDGRISNRSGGAAGSITTIAIGELHGDAQSRFNAFEGGGGPVSTNWEIGALNTDSDMAGFFADGPAAGVISHLTKVGSGTFTVTGLNTYSGDTTVEDGTLSFTQINTATAGDVFMFGDAILNLNFAGTDVIDSLFFDNVPQAVGTWGRIGHPTANFTSAFFTGDGLLQVSTLGVAPGLEGDYNNDGVVDAVDYTVWRNNLGDTDEANINNNGDGGGVTASDYDFWKARYGNTSPGAGAGGLAGAVPEPASWMLLLVAMAAGGYWRRRT